jgi:hypothetical protein
MKVDISLGDTVKWTNSDTVGHTVTSGKPSDPITGSIFDSSLIRSGGTFSYTFTYYGTFDYFCQVHPWMTGLVAVPARHVAASDLRFVDSFGNPITGPVQAGQQIQVVLDLTNNQNTDQPFAYLVQIQNRHGIDVSISWITGTLTAGQSLNPAQSWTPTYSDFYTAQAFVLQSITNPALLSQPMTKTFVVQGGPSHKYDSSPVLLSGSINPPFLKGFVTLLVLDPTNHLVKVSRASVASDGTFSRTIEAGGPLFTVTGTYTVKVEFRGALQNNLSFSCSSVSPISCS